MYAAGVDLKSNGCYANGQARRGDRVHGDFWDLLRERSILSYKSMRMLALLSNMTRKAKRDKLPEAPSSL